MLPATRVDPVVFRGLLRVFHMLDAPERLARDPELVLRSLPMLARVLAGSGPAAAVRARSRATRRWRGWRSQPDVSAGTSRRPPPAPRTAASAADRSGHPAPGATARRPRRDGAPTRPPRSPRPRSTPTARRPSPRRPTAWWCTDCTTSSVPSSRPARRLRRVESHRRAARASAAACGARPVAELIGDVRDQVAAERDVQELHAAADAQDRQRRARSRGARQRQLEAIALLRDAVVGVVVSAAVVLRIDVPTAGQDQPGDRVEPLRGLALDRWQDRPARRPPCGRRRRTRTVRRTSAAPRPARSSISRSAAARPLVYRIGRVARCAARPS